MNKLKIILIAGARPNFMKIAPIYDEIKKHQGFNPIIVHTGQHYDENMSKIFFDQLSIPKPDINLGVGSASHARQTAEIMIRFEDVLLKEKPGLVMVVGDVNSTIACSLVAAKMHIPVAHIEAGLRSHNWNMPEEINRILTDRLSDYLFTTCKDANENLIKEGINKRKIYFVGNVMIDTLLKNKELAKKSKILEKLKLRKGKYAVLTLHRPSNVDSKENLTKILETIEEIQRQIKIIYPAHPRAQKQINKFSLIDQIKEMENFHIIDPLGYLDFLWLMMNAKFVLTDSGGIQEETTILDIPCLTLRRETERPITVTQGTNVVVGNNKKKIIEESLRILRGNFKHGKTPELWDGKAAVRIVKIILEKHL